MIVQLAVLSLKNGVVEAHARLRKETKPKRKYGMQKLRGPKGKRSTNLPAVPDTR
jgi:hypothetical protein